MNHSNKKNINAVEVKNLTVSIDREPILKNLSFDIPAGSITAIIGPNGAGKTTLLRAMLNLIPIEKGTIKIFGNKGDKKCRHLRGHHLSCIHPSYVPQRFMFDKTFPITVNEFLEFALRPGQKKEKIDEALKEIGMHASKNKMLGTLSGGQMQRILIARALITEIELIFLDEPGAGIDIGGEKNFYELIKHLNEKHGSTCVLISHEIDIVFKYSHQVICLNKKLICQGVPEKILTVETLKKLYGEDIALYGHQYK